MARTKEGKCCRCHKAFNKLLFYKTYSLTYGDSGYMPVCKECVADLFFHYVDLYNGDKKKALKRICLAFDIYYNDKLFFASDSPDDEVILGNYMKKLNMMQYKNKTFDDSLNENFDFRELQIKVVSKDLEDESLDSKGIKKKDIRKWGDGFTKDDYEALNEHYEYLINANPNYDSNQEIFINELCYTKLLKDKAVKRGDADDFRKLSDSYRKSFEQAGLKTIEDVDADEFLIGVNVKTIEQYTPAEFYKDKKLYKDHDGIGEYFERFILRPLRNLQHGTSDRDYEYYVKEDGEPSGD